MRKMSLCLIGVLTITLAAARTEECTTAVITGAATADGRPMLWKNRDTDQLSNKVILVDEKPFRYLAVVNAEDTSGRIAWGGLNAAGFAVINSVAYNLPQKPGEAADLEGIVMADALRSCATADDFENFLRGNLGPAFGCRTNFCVIDAHGGAAIFEVHNSGYKRLDASRASEGYLVNTNFSRSGTADQGAGYIRFDRASELFRSAPAGKLTPEFVLQTAARDLGHPLLNHPPREAWARLPEDRPAWIHANYTIDRGITASTILVQGVSKGESPDKAVLWAILGEPVCSIAVPFWVAAGETPDEVRAGRNAPVYEQASRLQDLLRPLRGRDRKEYVDLSRLDNRAGTGWLPKNLELERQILSGARTLLSSTPTPDQLREYERSSAERVFAALNQAGSGAPDGGASISWTDARTLSLEGKGWGETKAFYDRLPAKAEGQVRDAVWQLSRDSAGMCVRFSADAPAIHVRWSLLDEQLALPHMPATGVSGVDLYVKTETGQWRWLGTGRPTAKTNTATLADNMPQAAREYMLYLPLYNGVTSVEIGVPKGSRITGAPPRPAERTRPVVFYGTSITQGGCASRPGMAYTAILGRRLDRPVVNLGFSGSAKMEPEVAALVAELDPALFVLDSVPNMTAGEIAERTASFVQALRGRHPGTPILIVEGRTYQTSFLNANVRRDYSERTAALRGVYDRMTAGGAGRLYFCPEKPSWATTAKPPWTAATRPIWASCGRPTSCKNASSL